MNNSFGIYNNSFSLIIAEIKKTEEIDKAVIFGSRAVGNYKKGSDIDIAIFGNKITFRILSSISYQLDEEIATPYFIDVVHYEKIKNDELKKHILEKGKVIYEK